MMVSQSRSIKALKLASTFIAAFALSSNLALANPSERTLSQFNQAAQGDSGLVDTVYGESASTTARATTFTRLAGIPISHRHGCHHLYFST